MLVSANSLKNGLKPVTDGFDDDEQNASKRATMVNEQLEAFQLIDERIDKMKAAP